MKSSVVQYIGLTIFKCKGQVSIYTERAQQVSLSQHQSHTYLDSAVCEGIEVAKMKMSQRGTRSGIPSSVGAS